jgi:protein CpxP
MTIKRNLTITSLIATVSLTALTMAGPANAQGPARSAPPAATAAQPAPTRAAIEQRMAERRAARTNDLATVLRLTPAQRPALNAFVASQTPPRRDPATAQADRQARRNLTPQQRLDQRQAFAARRAESLRTFTAALNPEQRQVFDALNRLRGSDGRGRGGARFGGPGHRDGGKGMQGPGNRGERGERGGRGDRGGPGAPPPPAR